MNALFWEDGTLVNFSGSVAANRDDLLAERSDDPAQDPMHGVVISTLERRESTDTPASFG